MVNCKDTFHLSAGPYIAQGQTRYGCTNIVFEFAELFLVAILLRNHTKID